MRRWPPSLRGARGLRLRFLRFLRIPTRRNRKNRKNRTCKRPNSPQDGEPLSCGGGTAATAPEAFPDPDPIDPAAIEERAALAADSVPACYLDAWARLQCQRPLSATEEAWRQAIDDSGLFLDAWGSKAAEAGWTPGELFDVKAGLVWRLAGERVEAIGADHVRLGNGRTLAPLPTA